MRAVILLCACACVVWGQDINSMMNMPKYDSRYDYLDVDALFNSKRLIRNYVECLINSQRCTPEGKALKRLLPEALRTKCVRCTERQKRTAVKIIKRLKNEYPDEWAKLASRWDPTGDFTRYFEQHLANEQFNTIAGSGQDLAVAPARPSPPVQLPPRIAPPSPPPRSPPSPPPRSPPPQTPPETVTTPPRPIILNRFGDDGELMVGSPSSAAVTPQPTAPTTMPPVTTARPVVPPRPTPISWASATESPTRFPLRPTNEPPEPYTTAITLIDQIGYKIIRTTEFVTDILRNTVRAVVGR